MYLFFTNFKKKKGNAMKKTILSFALVATIALLGFVLGQPDPYADRAPISGVQVTSPDTIPPTGFPYPTLFNWNYSTIPGVSGGTVGAMFFNGKYYLNSWSGTKVYRYNNNGPGGGPGTLADSLTYVGGCRDLTCDDNFIYGGNASTSIYRFDPNTMATLKTFTLTGGSTRAIAWDPNRKGFWNTGFSGNLLFHDTNGVLKTQITSTLAGKYGLCFDSTSSADSAFLWVWDQTSTAQNGLYKYHIQSGTLKASYLFTLTATSIGTAGGAEIIANAVPGTLTLLLNYQNFALVGYNMKNLNQIPTGTWTEQTSGTTVALYSVSAVNDNVAWTCGASGVVLKTINKGVNWVNVTGNIPTSLPLYCIFGWDANNAIVTGTSSGGTMSLYVTSNGGTNWTLANTHAGFGDDLWMTSATNGYYIGDPISGNWDLLASTNGGFNWSTWATVPTTNTSGTYNNAACFFGQSVWFESVGLSTIHYSSNMGLNWSTQSIPLSEITAIAFVTNTRGLAGGSSTSPGLLSTTNAGVNWTAITNPYATSSISGIVGAGTTWWVAQQGTGISKSTNDGANWTTDYTAPSGSFYHVTKSRAGATIWGVRSNGAISRYGATISGITPISTETPVDYALSQNYPNPFNPTTKINFAIAKAGMVTLKVYNVLGKEVATLVNQNLNAGNYNYDFNASSLSSGIYFYKLDVNGFTQVKKMTLIK